MSRSKPRRSSLSPSHLGIRGAELAKSFALARRGRRGAKALAASATTPTGRLGCGKGPEGRGVGVGRPERPLFRGAVGQDEWPAETAGLPDFPHSPRPGDSPLSIAPHSFSTPSVVRSTAKPKAAGGIECIATSQILDRLRSKELEAR